MSVRTPALRALFATTIAAAISTATVQENPVDPVTAARIVQDSGTTFISVAFARTSRGQHSHDYTYRATGDLDIFIYCLSPAALDATIELIHAALLAEMELRLELESMPAVVTDYEYLSAGDVNVAAARVRVSCQWTEEYPIDLDDYDLMSAIAMATTPGHMTGVSGHVVLDVDPITNDIDVDTDILVETCEEIAEFEEGNTISGTFDPDGDIIELEPTPAEPDGEPFETPHQERVQ